MKRQVGAFLIFSGIACLLFAAYPWIGIQYLRLSDPRPYHYYFVSDEAQATCIAIAAIGVALIGFGTTLFSKSRFDR